MEQDEADRIIAKQNAMAPWKELDPDVLAQRAETLADLMGDAPDGWAWNWFYNELRTGRVPTDMNIVTAWNAVRPNPFAGQATFGRAPREVLDDYVVWRQWETARRNAIANGATSDTADADADRALGITRRPAPTPPAGQTWREIALARLSAFEQHHTTIEKEHSL